MTNKPYSPDVIEKELNQLFPAEWLNQTAKECGFIIRNRKIDPVIFFWTLVLGFGVHLQNSLAKLRRLYETKSARSLVPSAFYDRFTPALVRFLKAAITRAFSQQIANPSRTLAEKLKTFQDIVVADGTLIRLCDKLAEKWPACRTNHTKAAIKLHLVTSAMVAGPRHLGIFAGTVPEIKTLKIGDWVKDRILLVDLGFFKYNLFSQITKHGGYFVSRLKDNCDPLIVASHRQHRGNAIDIAGKRLRFMLESLKRQIIDADVEVAFRVPKQNGKAKTALQTETYRLVGIRDQETGEYHIYLTNIAPEILAAEDIAQLYRTRWSIELIFKELKSTYALGQISSAKPEVMEALIYTAILTLIVSRKVLTILQRYTTAEEIKRMTLLRWANVFAVGAHQLLERVLTAAGKDPSAFDIVELFMAEALDPNVNRQRMMDAWTKA